MNNVRENLIQFMTSDGIELEGRLLRLGRFNAIFNVFSPENVLQTSGVLKELKIVTNGNLLYQGRATISGLVGIAGGVTCDVVLESPGLRIPAIESTPLAAYETFQRDWLASYKIRPEFKVVVADVDIFLTNMRQWLDDLALGFQAHGQDRIAEREQELMEKISPRLVASFNAVHERFEDIASRIEPEFKAVHQDFARRQLHPLFLCSPFGYRTYAKPLGYAGDYEMMNMILRNTYEGNSLFARAVHYWLVNQWPAKSVRNRISHLTENIINEVARVVRSGRRARILNLGCGPAWEVQEFFGTSGLSHETDFILMDFSHETLTYTNQKLTEIKRSRGLRAQIEMRHASVQQLLRSALQGKSMVENARFDFIYCAGLFDYLADGTCKAIVNLFYSWLQPGGLICVANMNDTKPFRHMVEFLLDWHLIYRDSPFMTTLIPSLPEASGTVIAEPTTVNLFTHVRKAAAL